MTPIKTQRSLSKRCAFGPSFFVVCCSGALLFALCTPVSAQQAGKVPRIGFLDPTSSAVSKARIEAFRQGLRKLGYTEGKNIAIDYRFADGKPKRLNDLATELVRRNVDIIVTRAIPGAVAAQQATIKTPIVFVGVADAVAVRLVASLARPGGNITGLTSLAPELSGKRLELLRQTSPKVSRVAVLRNPTNSGDSIIWKETEEAAQALGLQLHSIEVRNANDLKNAFESATRANDQGLVTLPDPLLQSHRNQIVEFTTKSRLPGIYPDPEYVEAGGLMSYAANPLEFYARASIYVDRILKGAKAGDLPVEQPTKFDLVINLQAAKQIGLTIPQKLLARADRVIR